MGGAIVVTGVAGFLGSHLAERLLRAGEVVIGIDNYLSGVRDNINWLRRYSRFTFVKHDIRELLPTEFWRGPIDRIYNLACPASPTRYTHYPVETLEVSSVGLTQVIALARHHKARLLQASTSEVYGDPTVQPQSEAYFGNVNPYGPRAMYDEGKRFAEARLWVARHHEGVSTAIVRIFNTYGPRMRADDGRVISTFINAALDGRAIPIHGRGEQSRSFCYVNDLVEGLIKMMESEEAGPINLGNPAEVRLHQLVLLLGKLLGRQLKVTHLEARPDDPQRRCPDISLARAQLGWEPKIDLMTGLKRTIDYFRKERIPEPI